MLMQKTAEERLEELLLAGTSVSSSTKTVSQEMSMRKRVVYDIALQVSQRLKQDGAVDNKSNKSSI